MGCILSKEDLIICDKKYEVIKKIADGGFGIINLVEDVKLKEQYALKQVRCESKKELETLGLENKYYKLLGINSNIIDLVADDVKEDKQISGFMIYTLFPYYQSGTLQDELETNLKSGSFIENKRLMNLFLGLCKATNFIHLSNLAHRDLKPHNVLLSNDRQTAILTDFGSMTEKIMPVKNSRDSSSIQDWAAQNCSMFYRAPELFEPKVNCDITEKADIWSIGCILYSMVYNKGPFDYVCERGDSIALAVANANFKIPLTANLQRHDYQIEMIMSMIVVDDSKRCTLIDNMNVIDIHSKDAGENVVV